MTDREAFRSAVRRVVAWPTHELTDRKLDAIYAELGKLGFEVVVKDAFP